MKITYNKTSKSNGVSTNLIGGRCLDIELENNSVIIEVNGIKVFLEGDFYYSVVGMQHKRIAPCELREVVASIVVKYGVNTIPTHLEGVYVFCWVDVAANRAGVFGDVLNRLPFYYAESSGNITMSTRLKDVASKSGGLDQNSLYSYLILGYPAGRDTFYVGVKKLGSDETIHFSELGVQHSAKSVPCKIESYDKVDLHRYDEIFTNAVSSRASDNNIVMNSGGWDSTSILYKLVESQPRGSVSAAVFNVVLPDRQSFNSYEVDKAKRIGKFFGIKTDSAKIDYGDQTLVDYWESNVENLRDNHTYFWLHHLKIADMIGSTCPEGTRVFNGEASDSIHNFGFSQFVSVNYDNIQLREIADKGKSYLYGPSFYEAILGDQGPEDKVLNFFQNYYGKEKFSDVASLNGRERRAKYFQAFMLSYPRVPFAKWHLEKYANNNLMNAYEGYIQDQYFNDMVKDCQPETLYYWLLQIYRRFHFNSYQIGVTQVALQPHKLHCVMPFLDSQMLEFMYRMPEDWGRGLELRTTKYPLRFLAEHKWRMPLDILMEKGPHSYIAEGDRRWSYSGGSWNIYCEIMFKSVFSKYFRSLLQNINLEEVFDSSLFSLDKMRLIVKSYVAGEENPTDVTLLFRLAVLFSIGFVK